MKYDSMTQKQAIQLFEEKRVRTAWDTDAEKWWFSIIDCIAVLTESPDPRNYWKVLKHRLKAKGNETVTNCNRLKKRDWPVGGLADERQTDSPERHSAHRRQHTRRGAVTNEHPTLYSHSITYCG